ncbi:Aste57867_6008 [Aphanomyces stellatus]|uniref:Aste57867_6008 protein n=1 Tax=Aphanomyces stellatus TaxID=120398 RepID=A0A485KFD5_9STRA|nr:hypothetical protein As57867_005994 [Aphanomyces stellatus]VFT83022.1 Aste57867_6008 [Aphanomyces stellatus]
MVCCRILAPEFIEAIAAYISSADVLFAWLQVLPPDALGRPLESLLALHAVGDTPTSRLWPHFVLNRPALSSHDKIACVRHASALFPFVYVSSVWDVSLLRRALHPHTAVSFTNPPSTDDVTPERIESWLDGLATAIPVVFLPHPRAFPPRVYLDVLPRLVHLQSLQLQVALQPAEQDLLMDALGASTSIASLTLNLSSLGEFTRRRLDAFTQWLKQGKTLDLRGLSISDTLAPCFARAVIQAPALSTLILRDGSLALALLAHATHIPAQLIHLTLAGTTFPSADAASAAMSNFSHAFVRPRTNTSGASDSFFALSGPLSVTELNLNDMDLGGVNVAPHLTHMAVCTAHSLMELDMSDNWIGDAGALALAAALPSLHVLRTVTLSRNEIEDAGGRALLAAIPACPSLETVVLGSNEIGRAGANVAADVVSRCLHLRYMELPDNPLTKDGVVAILHALAARRDMPMAMELGGPDLTSEEHGECVRCARTLGVYGDVSLSWSYMNPIRRVPRSRLALSM